MNDFFSFKVRRVPKDVAGALVRQAQQNGRPCEAELREIIRNAVGVRSLEERVSFLEERFEELLRFAGADD